YPRAGLPELGSDEPADPVCRTGDQCRFSAQFFHSYSPFPCRPSFGPVRRVPTTMPQASQSVGLAGLPSALDPSLHSDLGIVAQRRREFLLKMTRQCIRRGVFRSIADLQAEINTYLAEYNASPKPLEWPQSAETILVKLDRCPVPSIRFSALETPMANPMLGPAASAARHRRRASGGVKRALHLPNKKLLPPPHWSPG